MINEIIGLKQYLFRRFRRIKALVTPKKDCLVYIGLYMGAGFDAICWRYKVAYGFEANPDLYEELKNRYRGYPNIHVVQAAVATFNGKITFNISDNEGASSSIGNFNEHFPNKIKMIRQIEVPAMNLYDFCQDNQINFITDYISDAQGMDLEIVKTMELYI